MPPRHLPILLVLGLLGGTFFAGPNGPSAMEWVSNLTIVEGGIAW